jgi:hypothetical protein
VEKTLAKTIVRIRFVLEALLSQWRVAVTSDLLQVFWQFKHTRGIDLDGGFPDQTLSYTTGRQQTLLEIQGTCQ